MKEWEGWTLENLNSRYKKQAATQLNCASALSNMEQSAGNEPLAEKEAPRFDRPVSLAYLETRKRLADSDGACTKYFTDALVSAGLLRDDSTKEIPERPKHRQVKGKQEQTIIEIWSV